MAQLHLQTRFIITVLIILKLLALHAESSTLHEETSMFERHEQWMVHHGRVYSNDAERTRRFQIFQENVEFIDAVNARRALPYVLSVNKFADLTDDEFRATRTNGYNVFPSDEKSSSKDTPFRYENVTKIPTSIDWRKKGAVTPIKDQGECRSCWAFAAVGAIEGITKIATGKLTSLSEQELVDCVKGGKSQGCQGGYSDEAFVFVKKNEGISSEEDYPYEGQDGTCNPKKKGFHAAKIKGYEKVPSKNEEALLKAVANQPVSAYIKSSSKAFKFYSSGVLRAHCTGNVDHVVTVVGYGDTDDGTKYWLIKNSWGTDWGENGYMRIERGVRSKHGLCGVAVYAYYPIA